MTNAYQGFTLIELLIVIALISVLASITFPAFGGMMQRIHLKSAAVSLQTDIQWARILAIKKSQNILVSRTTGNMGAWCYGLAVKTSSKTQCDCNQSTVNTADDCELKSISGSDYSDVNMATATINNNTFDFRRGTINANGVTLATEDYAVRIVFSDVGRVRLCIPATANRPTGTIGLPNVPNCL
jgi:type IV fimbrial biogenesis protein FimT